MIDFPIVDSHVHLLDMQRFKYSWAAGAPALQRDWSIDDLMRCAAPAQIDAFVFAEVDVDDPQYLDEARWVEEMSKKDKRLKGCVAALPMERGVVLESEMAELAKLSVARGVRRLIQNQKDPGYVLQPKFIEAVKLLPRYKLSFDICIFHTQMENTLAFMRQCPDVSFILDHIGKPGIKAGLLDPWRAHLKQMAQMPNVVCKLSGVTTEADHKNWNREQLRPYIDHVINCFGFDRVMYGGDWPVSELAGKYADWLATLDWATSRCSAEERRKLFRDTAIRAYRLDM
jgi:L-fuconolactonase